MTKKLTISAVLASLAFVACGGDVEVVKSPDSETVEENAADDADRAAEKADRAADKAADAADDAHEAKEKAD